MQEDSKEIGKRKCIAYPHLELYIAINLILFLCSIGAFCILSVNKNSMLIIGHSCSRFCKLRTVVTRYLCAITLLAYKYKTKQGFQKIYKMRENN